MASYKRFEETPVWNLAIDLAAAVFELTSHAAFKYRESFGREVSGVRGGDGKAA